jgi:DNA-binding GntR family transcriptional regulator
MQLSAIDLTEVRRDSDVPLRDQILRRCQLMLMSGQVEPGQKLPLRPLAKRLDTSLMPVRDALNRLVADGALELSSNRTIQVPVISNTQMIEICEIRTMLEGLATERATPNLTNDSIDRLEGYIVDMRDMLNAKDYDNYILKHYSFHFTIYAAAGQSRLLNLIEIMWLQIGPWFRQKTEQANLTGTPNIYHKEVVSALRARDAVAARKNLELDVMSIVRYLRQGAWG